MGEPASGERGEAASTGGRVPVRLVWVQAGACQSGCFCGEEKKKNSHGREFAEIRRDSPRFAEIRREYSQTSLRVHLTWLTQLHYIAMPPPPLAASRVARAVREASHTHAAPPNHGWRDLPSPPPTPTIRQQHPPPSSSAAPTGDGLCKRDAPTSLENRLVRKENQTFWGDFLSFSREAGVQLTHDSPLTGPAPAPRPSWAAAGSTGPLRGLGSHLRPCPT